jgi:hypothetical protein
VFSIFRLSFSEVGENWIVGGTWGGKLIFWSKPIPENNFVV